VVDTLHAKMDYPLVLLEALLVGVPVLVSRGTAGEEIVASGGARAVSPGDDAALAAAAEEIAADATAARAMGVAGGRWVRATCGPAVVAEAYERVYDEISGTRR
jgi:glycosyltransferase involved in cell wall biosynthesis